MQFPVAVLLFSILPAFAQGWLPPDAKVIEDAGFTNGRGQARRLVLWMLSPKRVLDFNVGGCAAALYADHWSGRARLSLVNNETGRLIQTIRILDSRGADAAIPIPFRVPAGSFYYSGESGKTEVLRLRDLTGEGVAAQFLLAEYQNCGGSLTSAFGYNNTADTVVQFRIVSPGSTQMWLLNAFLGAPIRPGHWRSNWGIGYGADVQIREEMDFDKDRQIFVNRRFVSPIEAYDRRPTPRHP